MKKVKWQKKRDKMPFFVPRNLLHNIYLLFDALMLLNATWFSSAFTWLDAALEPSTVVLPAFSWSSKQPEYYVSKKSLPILYTVLLFRMGQDFLDTQYGVLIVLLWHSQFNGPSIKSTGSEVIFTRFELQSNQKLWELHIYFFLQMLFY